MSFNGLAAHLIPADLFLTNSMYNDPVYKCVPTFQGTEYLRLQHMNLAGNTFNKTYMLLKNQKQKYTEKETLFSLWESSLI